MGNAVTEASNLNKIQFPEFTAKLLTDTFDALVDANVRQIESYTQLVQTLAEGLTEYINNTKDDISGEEIMGFLNKHFPDQDTDAEYPSTINPGVTNLDSGDADKLNEVLELEKDNGSTIAQASIAAGTDLTDENAWDLVVEAVAKRVANNKYNLLQEMVNQGMLRLVVDKGVVETSLNFNTASSDYARAAKNSSSYTRKSKGGSIGGSASFGWGWGRVRVGGSYSSYKLNVNTSNQSNTSGSNSSQNVNIRGGVRIEFSTDYKPLG